MHFSTRKLGVLLIAFFTFSALAAAETAREIPLRGAPAPSLAEAARVINAARVSPLGEPLPNTHIVSPNGIIFQTLTPCRLVDTRNSTYFYGGPKFASGETRTYDPAQIPLVTCGGSSLPNALAWYMNITVTGTTGGPAFLTAFATGTPRPTVATVNWGFAGAQVNNSVIVAAGTSSAFDVYVSSSTDVIIDIVGLFISNLTDTAGQLAVTTSIGGLAAIVGFNNSNTDGSHGVGGFEGGSGVVHGVQGQISASANTGSSGVHGIGAATGKATFGVFGEAGTAAIDSAGVKGLAGDGEPPGSVGCCFAAGVRGDSDNWYGVVGVSRFIGTFGILKDTAGNNAAKGELGTSLFGGPWAVYGEGNIGASGAKPFVEVHPTDPSKLIRYVALEGPEAGTYFRGTDETSQGMAVIPVPESFRLVTDAEGLTVQLTPIGAPATMYVVSQDLNQIVVRSSRDVRFHYMVNGVRATFKDWQVIVGDSGYMPDGPDARLPAYFSPEQQRRLISNGTYNADGTVNMGTAARLGWTKIWADRMAKAEAASRASAAKMPPPGGNP